MRNEEVWLLIGGVVVALIVLATIVRLWRKARFEQAAHALGLDADTSNKWFQMSGERYGRAVAVSMVNRKVGTRRNKEGDLEDVYRWFTEVRLDAIRRLLPTGTRVDAVRGLGQLFDRVAETEELDLGDPKLEAAFDFTTLGDRELMSDLFRDREVQDRLRPLASGAYELSVSSDRLFAKRKGRHTSRDGLIEIVERLEALADALAAGYDRAQARSVERVCDTVWAEVADELGLAHRRERFEGRHAGVSLRVVTRVEGDRRVTRFEATLDPPAADALALAPAGLIDKLADLVGRGDIETGHEAFDARFALRGEPEATIRERFDGAVCDAVLALAEQGTVQASAERLELEVPSLVRDPERLRALIGAVIELAQALTPRAPTSAFR